MEINPNYQYAVFNQGNADLAVGDFGGAIQKIEGVIKAIPNDPHVPLYLASLSLANLLAGSVATAIELAKEGLDRRPNVPLMGLVYAAAASDDETLVTSNEFRDMVELTGVAVPTARELPLIRESDVQFLEERLRKAGAPESRSEIQ